MVLAMSPFALGAVMSNGFGPLADEKLVDQKHDVQCTAIMHCFTSTNASCDTHLSFFSLGSDLANGTALYLRRTLS